MFLVNIDKEL